ncbi:acyl carrier protein [Saccharopolyspora phatthalungensis]|uniref:Acyl carrier protein n=1 Tax=Saccharopolyspora phatthalungensis TaxID=664693 RepID=A0A840QG12_9PSEU|nr:acyl carrier protein [Saccharopolyspora phatthalungensis]MBB5157549.1 acyl carrier protein [Saccharopolyspora phatthalungensis]
MPQPITPDRARDLVHDALRKAMPGADLDTLDEHENFREALELDSLDFLTFVEALGNAAGIRIDEDDYDKLTTMRSTVDFLTTRT